MRIFYSLFIAFLFFSNHCIAQDCAINNLIVEAFADCNDDGSFGVDIAFDVENGNEAGFDLFVNGDFYQYFETYPDPFVRIDEFWLGNGSDVFIYVQDNDNLDCGEFLTFTTPECPGTCSLTDLSVEIGQCDIFSSTYAASITFGHSYIDRSEIQVYHNEEKIGNIFARAYPKVYQREYGNLSNSNPSGIDVFKICANESETCCIEVEVEAPDCTSTECLIGDLNLEERSECDPNGIYSVYPHFEYINTSDSCLIYIDGNYFGTFAYINLDLIELSPFIGDGSIYEIKVQDQINLNCFREGTIGPINCIGNETCYVSAPNFEVECNYDGTYNLHFYFEHENTSGFVDFVCDNFETIKDHPVDQQPIIVGPIAIQDIGISFNVFINDSADPQCNGGYIVDFFGSGCEECQIADINIGHECLDDGTYNLNVFYEHQFTSGEIIIRGNGNNYGQFDVNQQPIVLGPFTNDQTINELVIIDSENEFCSRDIEFDPVDCVNTADCSIEIDQAELYCDGANFFIVLDYAASNLVSEAHFYVNDVLLLQSSEVGQNLNVSFGPLPAPIDGEYIISVLDAEFEICTDEIKLVETPCDFGGCEIESITYEQECLDNGTYFVYLFVTSEFVNNYNVRGNGTNYGNFNVFEEIKLGPFGPNDVVNEFVVFNATTPTICSNEVIFEAEPCEPVGDCVIYDIVVETYECNPEDGSYSMDIDFEYLDPGNDFFEVWINNELIDYFPFADGTSLTFNNIIPRENSDYDIVKVCVNDHPDCCDVIEYMPPNCSSDCSIDISVAELYCDGANFYIDLVYHAASLFSEAHFYVNEQLLFESSQEGEELFVTLGPLDPAVNGQYVINVSDAELEECSAQLILDEIPCEPSPCFIGEITVEQECLEDGTYYVYLNFEHSDNISLVNVRGNGTDYGNFVIPGEIKLGPFELSDAINEFVVIYNENGIECLNDVGFEAEPCEPSDECIISVSVIETYDCDPEDGSYSMNITVSEENAENDFFEIWINGEYIGFYSFLNGSKLQLTNIMPRINSDYDIIVVCVNDDPNCCKELEYLPPNCSTGEECEINELNVEVECLSDGTFIAYINFEHQGTSGQVDIRGNGTAYGEFDVAKLPIILGPLEANTGLLYEFVVFDVEDEDCKSVFELGLVNCDNENKDCELSNLRVDEIDCDLDNGTYDASVFFQFQNPGNDFFDVWVNNEYYGFYPFAENPPFQIIGITPRANSDYDIIRVCVNDNEECCIVLEYEKPACFNTTNPDDPKITNIEIETLDCNEQGTSYSINLNFETENFSGDQFYLWVNDFSMGSIDIQSLPIIYAGISPRPGTDQDIVKICLDEDEEFCEIREYDQPDCLMVGTEELEVFKDLRIFPNPSSESLNIQGLKDDIIAIKIINHLGHTVKSIKQGTDKVLVNDLTNGVYFVEFVTNDNYIHTKKFIKIN